MSVMARVWAALTVITLAFWMLPETGHAVQADPYRFTTLMGIVDFQYERYRSETANGNFTDKTDSFQQYYSLSILGQVLSRRLMVYDAGVSWTDIDYKTNSTDRETKTLDYFLTTTLLPLSRIPLTLYGNSLHSETSGASSQDDTRITYGLKWLMNFRTLPKTKLFVERQLEDVSNTDKEQLTVKLDMEKELGPTKNTFNYKFTDTDIPSSSDPYTREMNEHIFHLTNTTHISKSTLFSIGGTRGIQKHPQDTSRGDSTLTGLSASFTSRPSSDFSQLHNYTYFNNISDSGMDNTGHFYNGDMKYWFSDNLRTSLDLSFEKRDDDTTTQRLETNSLQTSFSLDYYPTDNLTFTEYVSYSDYDATSDSALTPSTGSRREFAATSAVRYYKPYDWARMSLSYSIGYTDKSYTQEGQGTGIDQELSAGFGAINFNRYVGFDTYGRVRYLEGISGDIWERDTEFNLEAYNKRWQEYVELLAKYNRMSTAGWVNILTRKSSIYSLDAKTDIINNTKIFFHSEAGSRYDEVTGDVEFMAADLSATHSRLLLSGMLDLSARWGFRSNQFTNQKETTSSANYLASYRRRLTFNLGWKAEFERSEDSTKSSDTGEEFTTTKSSISNTLIYRLRAWVFNASHKYTLTQDNTREQTENYIFLRASRKFLRFF